MNKKYIVKESRVFDEVIETGKKIKNYNFIIFYKEKKDSPTKYGITVPKKVGKAHIRNNLKRRVRAIIRNYNKDYEKNYNCIIIIRNSCLNLSYQELSSSLQYLLDKIK
jgi:ribonuclease P protein component